MDVLSRDRILRVMSVTRFHFVAGLPGAGAARLTALLAQNPRFSTASGTPAAALVEAMLKRFARPDTPEAALDEQQRKALLRGALDAVHHARQTDGVVFDNNPAWLAHLGVLAALFPLSRFIVLVREAADLGEAAARAAPDSPTGRIVAALAGRHAERIIVIERDRFLSDPVTVLDVLYHFLREPVFEHDVEQILDETGPDLREQGLNAGLRRLLKPRPGGQPRPGRLWPRRGATDATVLLDRA
jgi:sulfotransferase